MGLFKRIRITEGTSLQLRAEVFNILNHANLYVDGNSIEVNNGFVGARRGVLPDGTVTDRRNVQLAVKFIF